jgi:hypothetical protein
VSVGNLQAVSAVERPLGQDVLARLMASPRLPAAMALQLDEWVGEVRDLLPRLGQPPRLLPGSAGQGCRQLYFGCQTLASWARSVVSGQLPGGEQLRAMAADPRRGVPMRLHVLASLLERVQGVAPAGGGSSSVEVEVGRALTAVRALAGVVDGAAQLPGGAAAAGTAGGGPASQQQRPKEREEQREREAQMGHAALVSELLGELLVGQAVPAGHLATGAEAGAGALGQQQQAQPGQQQQQQVGPPPAPVKLPGLLQAAGCWHLGCMRLGGSARTQACEGCGLARYCEPGCQRAHWPLHRAQCLRWRGQLGGVAAHQAGAGQGAADKPAGG